MQSSFVLRILFGHALLSTLRLSDTVVGVVGSSRPPPPPPPPPSSSLSSAGGRTNDEDDDGDHDGEDSPGAPSLHHPGAQSDDGFVSEWNKDWSPTVEGGGRMSQGKCVDVPDNMTLCRGIGYARMRLPNLLEHDSVREAIQQATSWIPLMNVRCHPDTQVFLCSLFAPVCLERAVWPCKTLCEAVKAGCESRMRKYGFPWPEMLRCDQFPSDNELCIGMRQENQSDESSCPACVQTETFEIIVDNFCNADYAVKIRVQEATVVGSDLKLVANKKKKVFKKGALTSKELRDFTVNVENVARCKCEVIEELKAANSKNNAGSFLVMGTQKNERLVVSFIEKIEKTSADMTKAMEAIRRGKICKAGMKMITPEDPNRDNGKGKTDKLRDNKSDGGKTEVKREKQEDEKSKTGTKVARRKEDRKKVNGKKEEITKIRNKSDDVARNTKQDEARKSNLKNERRRNENGKRSTSKEPSNAHSAEKRNRQKEPKST